MHAVERFQESSGNGNALATANLAHLLLDRGFIQEARRLIDLAMSLEPANERAATALARITTEYRNEEDRITKTRQIGERLRTIFRRVGEEPSKDPVAGTYAFDNGTKMVVGVEDGQVKGKFDDGAKVSFHLDGPMLSVERTSGPFDFTKHSGRGHAHEGELIFYLSNYPNPGETAIFRGSVTES
jgi:hypothetical protein